MKKSINLFGKKVKAQKVDEEFIDLDLEYDEDDKYSDNDCAEDDDYVGEGVETSHNAYDREADYSEDEPSQDCDDEYGQGEQPGAFSDDPDRFAGEEEELRSEEDVYAQGSDAPHRFLGQSSEEDDVYAQDSIELYTDTEEDGQYTMGSGERYESEDGRYEAEEGCSEAEDGASQYTYEDEEYDKDDSEQYAEEEDEVYDAGESEEGGYYSRNAKDLEREAYERGDEPDYEEEYDDYRDDEDYDYDDRDFGGYDDEGFAARLFGAIRNSSGVERAAAAVAVVLLAGSIFTFSFYSKALSKTEEIGSFSNVGSTFGVTEVVGQSGLIAIADAERAKAMAAAMLEENAAASASGLDAPEVMGEERELEEEENKNVTVKVSLTSVKSDIKIKFTNAANGKLISGVHFEVTVVNPDGTTITYDDHDMDGIIYKNNLTSGTYRITPVALSEEYADYTMDTGTQSLSVKGTVAMKKVDVSNEVKKESEVNAAAEDTQVRTAIESQLKDTVEYVDSTKTAEAPAKTENTQTTNTQTANTQTTGSESTSTQTENTQTTNTQTTETQPQTQPETTQSAPATQGTVAGEGEFEFQEIDKSSIVDPTLSGKLENSAIGSGLASNTTVRMSACAMAGNVLTAKTGTISNDRAMSPSSIAKAALRASALATLTDEQIQQLVDLYNQQNAGNSGAAEGQIQLGTTSISLEVGGFGKIEASAPGAVRFSSEDNSIVQVAGDGTVVGIAEGTTAIRVSSDGCSDTGVVVTVKKGASQTQQTQQSQDGAFSCTTKSLTLKVGQVGKIAATANKPINYQSQDESIAIVTADGQVGGNKEGKTKIIVYTDNEHFAEVEVKVVNANQSNMSLSTSSLKMTVGSLDFIAVTGPKSVTFTSSNQLVAMVDENGQVAAMSEGTANITISAEGYNDAVVKVTVVKKADKDIKVKQTEITTAKGRSVKIELEDKTIKAKFTSGNTSVATVSADGTVKGIGIGISQITVSADGYNDAKVGVKIIDNTIQLKDNDGNTVYVKNADGTYRIATVDDYFNGTKFYTKKSSGSSSTNYKYTGWQTIDGKTYYYDKDGKPVTGEQVIQGAKYTFDKNGVLTTASGTMGIDVSKWNGDINWDKVKNSGVHFVIIRCGYRGSSEGALIEDPKFRANIQGAINAGLRVGVYFFTQAINEVEAVEEASMVIDLVDGYNISLPIYLDVEASNGRADSISVSQRTANIKAFCGTIQNAGYRAGVYANKTWFNEKINVSELTNYKIWLAQYAASVTYTRSRYDMWQYTSKGKVSGISGDVDMNILYNN